MPRAPGRNVAALAAAVMVAASFLHGCALDARGTYRYGEATGGTSNASSGAAISHGASSGRGVGGLGGWPTSGTAGAGATGAAGAAGSSTGSVASSTSTGCAPSCGGKECGAPDGCNGACIAGHGCCTPNCGSKTCGQPDGCTPGMTCQPGSGCCQPQCHGVVCAPKADGCGGPCSPGGGCISSKTFNVGFGDPAFGGACPTNSGADMNSLSCVSAASRYCRKQGFVIGHPVQWAANSLSMICGSWPSTTLMLTDAMLAQENVNCTAAHVYTVDCMAACDNACKASGKAGGFGPVEHGGGNSTCDCIDASVGGDEVVPASVLSAACDGSPGLRSTACDVDDDNYCSSQGKAGGVGPVQAVNANANISVVCFN